MRCQCRGKSGDFSLVFRWGWCWLVILFCRLLWIHNWCRSLFRLHIRNTIAILHFKHIIATLKIELNNSSLVLLLSPFAWWPEWGRWIDRWVIDLSIKKQLNVIYLSDPEIFVVLREETFPVKETLMWAINVRYQHTSNCLGSSPRISWVKSSLKHPVTKALAASLPEKKLYPPPGPYIRRLAETS